MQSDGSRSPHHVSADRSREPLALTPTQTPPEHERRARPGPGEIKGYKIVFDPEMATGGDEKNKRKYKPKYIGFGDKVRAASNQVDLLM